MMLTALGLMSGTSLDGVDVALIETDGRQVKAFGPSSYRAYTPAERNLLRQAPPLIFINDGNTAQFKGERDGGGFAIVERHR